MLSPQAYVEDLLVAGIQVDALNMSRGIPDPRVVLRLSQMLSEQRSLVLHAHMIHANLLARIVRLVASVPVVICTAHSTYELPTGADQVNETSMRERAYRWTDRLCDLTTQVSQAGVERYIRVKAAPAGKLRFMPNGIDVRSFSPNAQMREQMRSELGIKNQFVWLAVGRFDEAKDYPNLIHAFSKIPGFNSVLLIAGQGPLMAEAQSLCSELGLGERVRFLGVRGDIPNIMRAADAYVLSSFYEGLPLVLLEAAATELPIVATDVGGVSELVLNEKTGFIVPARDSDALAGAAATLMSLPAEVRSAMGKRARAQVVAGYSIEYVADRWESIYKALLLKKGITL